MRLIANLLQRAQKIWQHLADRSRCTVHAHRANAFLACFPKSGSTYLYRALLKITGYDEATPVQFLGHNDQDLYEPLLKRMVCRDTVTQQHCKGTGNNVDLMLRYGIRPVVLVRNLCDALVSVHDHIETRTSAVPMVYVHAQYRSLSEEDKYRFLASMCVPYYLTFFVSWLEARARVETLWLTYESVFADPESALDRILSFYGLIFDRGLVRDAIASMGQENTRFNKGVSGRGKSLPADVLMHIADTAHRWHLPDDAMRMIGIGEEGCFWSDGDD